MWCAKMPRSIKCRLRETVIVSEKPVDVEKLKQAIADTGYTVTGVETKPYEKKGFFSFLKK